MKTRHAIALATVNVAFGASMALGLALAPHGHAQCSDGHGHAGVCQYAIDYSGELSAYVGLPVCAEEDGNVDGQPCIWTSRRTGLAYWVDSSSYR